MKYTNRYGLPASIVRAVQADPYDKGDADFSATELLKPPQVVRLYNEHGEKISEDVSDAVWKLLGSGVHAVLERAYDPEEGVTEQRLFSGIDIVKGSMDGMTISGAMDLREHGKITDYKVTATYTVMRGDFSSWEQQLNIYDWLARQNDIEIDELEIVAILRDWKKSQKMKRGYPEAPVKKVPIVKWSHVQQEDFIRRKIAEHQADPPRECTDEEIWGGVRCRDWCLAAPYCPQYQGAKK